MIILFCPPHAEDHPAEMVAWPISERGSEITYLIHEEGYPSSQLRLRKDFVFWRDLRR